MWKATPETYYNPSIKVMFTAEDSISDFEEADRLAAMVMLHTAMEDSVNLITHEEGEGSVDKMKGLILR